MNRNYVIVELVGKLFVSMPMDAYCVCHTALYKQGLIAPDPTFTASRLRDAWARWFHDNHPEKEDLIRNLEARGTFLDLEVYAYFPEMYKVAVLVDHLEQDQEDNWIYHTAEDAGEIYGTDLPDWQATAWRFLYHHVEEHMYVPIQRNEAPQGVLFNKNQLKLIDDEHLVRFSTDIQKCTGPRRHGEPAERMLVRNLMVPHANRAKLLETFRKLGDGNYRNGTKGKATLKVDGDDLPEESEPKRPRPNRKGESTAAIEGYVMHWPGVVGAFVPGDKALLPRSTNPTVCVHCLVGLPHRHSNAQRALGLVDPKLSERTGEPGNPSIHLVLNEDCADNPLLLQADYAEVNALWYSAMDDQDDPAACLVKWREFFKSQWIDMTDEQKLLYLLSRKARPLVLRARAEPAWWPRDDEDRDGPTGLVAGGRRVDSSLPNLVKDKTDAKDFIEKYEDLTKIDHGEFLPCSTPLIKEEKQAVKTHHDELSPPVTIQSSTDTEKLYPTGTVTIVNPVRTSCLLIFNLKMKN